MVTIYIEYPVCISVDKLLWRQRTIAVMRSDHRNLFCVVISLHALRPVLRFTTSIVADMFDLNLIFNFYFE